MSWTTSWWQWPYVTTPPNYYYNGGGASGSSDNGLLYFWSPLVIALVVIAVIVGLVIIAILACVIYNYCTYGMCSPFDCLPSWGDCCSFCTPGPPTKVMRQRHVSFNNSVRSSRRGGDDVVVVRRPSVDRKVVRIEEPESVRVRRSAPQEVCIVPQQASQQPIIIQTPIMCSPAMFQQPVMQPQMQYQPTGGGFQGGGFQGGGFQGGGFQGGGFQGGELRVTIGGATQTGQGNRFVMNQPMSQPSQGRNQPNRFVYSMGQGPVSCQIANNQPNEYVLTSVEGASGGGGGFGGFGESNKGFDNWEQDGGSVLSDGQHSAVIDIGRGGGGGNNFYPSLPTYDE